VVGKAYNKKLEKLYIGQEAGPSLVLDHCHLMHKFYGAANAVCGRVKFASPMSALFLLETFCLPMLSYCVKCYATVSNRYRS